jgi:hypothetical protein
VSHALRHSGARICALGICAICFASVEARAAAIYGTTVDPPDYAGERVYFQSDGEDAKIAWEITDNGNGTFTYRYTAIIPNIEGPDGFKSVSHFTLDLSDDFDDDDQQTLLDTLDSNSVNFDLDLVEFGDKDTLTGAVKFDFGGGKPEDGGVEDTDGNPLYYEFTVNRAPVWGNFAIKDGNGTFRNAALENGTVLTSMDKNDFIAVPNGQVPEPASLVLAAAALAALAVHCAGRRLGARPVRRRQAG